MKRAMVICMALLLLVGCAGGSPIEPEENTTIIDSSYAGITFAIPNSWESGTENGETYYVSPQKQVLMIGRLESESNIGDIKDEWDRENFLDIARSGAAGGTMTSSTFITVDGVTGYQVTYDTLNGSEVMKVIHTGFTRGKVLYQFLLLMPADAADTSEYQQIISSIVFS